MDVQVIGAGLSGLSTAWYLTDAGARVHVVESGPGPGGLIETQSVPAGMVETAARAFVATERVTALFTALGLAPASSLKESKQRYILRNGRPRRWPLTPVETLTTLAYGARALTLRATKPREEESVHEWALRVAGRPATDWLVGPALQGIYATSPERLSAKALFGMGARTRGPIVAPEGGMGELMARLRTRLAVRGATFSFGTSIDRIGAAQRVAICTGAPAAAALLRPVAPALADAIARIPMVSLMPVTVFFAPHPQDIRGFGILFPRVSGIRALGALFNADMFPGRSTMRSETWIYGDVHGNVPSAMEAEAAVLADRERLTGRRDQPVSVHPLARPAQLPVYSRDVVVAHAALGELPPTIGITGNYLGRIGISGILESAAETAARLAGPDIGSKLSR